MRLDVLRLGRRFGIQATEFVDHAYAENMQYLGR